MNLFHLRVIINIFISIDEEGLKELTRLLKILKEQNIKLTKENINLRAEVQEKSNAKEIQKLKQEKLLLSRQIMDLEGENVLYKKSSDIFLIPNLTFDIEAFHFCFLSTSDKKNKLKIKESLKNKNEEILILKSELLKKEQQIAFLQRKNKGQSKPIKKEVYIIQNEKEIPNNKNGQVLNQKLYSCRSDRDFFHSSFKKYETKYFSIFRYGSKKTQKNLNQNFQKETSNLNEANNQVLDIFTSREKRNNLNISITNDGEDLNKDYIEKNIFSEIKNLMEEKKKFILQTMTYENFSFDIIPQKNLEYQCDNLNSMKANTSRCTNKKESNIYNLTFNTKQSFTSNNALSPQIGFNLTQDIDLIIEKIRQRKKYVINQKSNVEKLKNHYE